MSSVQFKVQFEGRMIDPCDDSITQWMMKNNKSRQQADLPRELFVPGFQIDGIFYPVPDDMDDYVLRSTKVGVGAKCFGCAWVLGEGLDMNEASEYAPYEDDYKAYYALSEAVRDAHLWWGSFEDQGSVMDEVLYSVAEAHGLPEPASDDTELGKQMVAKACAC